MCHELDCELGSKRRLSFNLCHVPLFTGRYEPGQAESSLTLRNLFGFTNISLNSLVYLVVSLDHKLCDLDLPASRASDAQQ
jgi:hypothetical protein